MCYFSATQQKSLNHLSVGRWIICLWLSLGAITLSYSVLAQSLNPQRAWNTPPDHRNIAAISRLLSMPENQLNYLDAKLLIDQKIAPFSFNAQKVRDEIDSMVKAIKDMLPFAASDVDKLKVIRQYIYDSGSWNNFRPFEYDMNDPFGTQNPKGPLLYNYLETRKGNCVSMPILFIILAEKLGLDLTLTHAPKHLLVYFVEKNTQRKILIETTSRAHPARVEWVVKQLNIKPKALETKIYLDKLSKRQSIVLMSDSLASHYYKKELYHSAIKLSELHLKYYPRFVGAILNRGASYGWLNDYLYKMRYPKFWMIPPEKQSHADFLSRSSVEAFKYAESLGWEMEMPEQQSLGQLSRSEFISN